MALPERMKFGIFLAPFHWMGDNPTLCLERDMELLQLLDSLDYDEAWIGEHHSAGWETIASPEVFIAAAAERTKRIKLGTGVLSLPYHHPLMAANRMVLLDHMTRGRVMMGVGPGALVSDAYMMGIDPPTQRRRMDESLSIILRLMKSTEPITYESEWFTLKEALLHLRPYTRPHMPIAVAAAQSPSGMVVAGKHGAGVLSVSMPRAGVSIAVDPNDPTVRPPLREYWKIAEDTAAQHGQTMNREEWRLTIHVHLAESREEAREQARIGAGRYQREYFENTLGNMSGFDGPQDEIIDFMMETNQWCVGTPDDLIDFIYRLDEESGGFGGLLIQATEWATREQVFHSYELLARYVMPHFQGSLVNLKSSQEWSIDQRDYLQSLRRVSLQRARDDYKGG